MTIDAATRDDDRPGIGAADRRVAFVVIGMHRSGTSAMARVLSLSGATLPNAMMGAGPHNEKGHWEPETITALNDEIFAALDTRWNSPFPLRRNGRGKLPVDKFEDRARALLRAGYGEADTIVLKDPRISLLGDFWIRVIEAEGWDPRFVIMIRNPREVARSLFRREQTDLHHSLLLWSSYTAGADLSTRARRRVFVSYTALLTDVETVLDRIERALDIDLPRRTHKSVRDIAAFLDPASRHHVFDKPSIPVALEPVRRLFAYACACAGDEAPKSDTAQIVSDWLSGLDLVMSPLMLFNEQRFYEALAERDVAFKVLEAERDQLRVTVHFMQQEHWHKLQIAETTINEGLVRATQAEARVAELEALLAENAQPIASEDL